MLRNGYFRLAIATTVAAGIAVGATLLGGQVERPSVWRCVGEGCESLETQYHSYGWPIPWRTDAPAAEVERLLRYGRYRLPPGLGINSDGIAPYPLGATLALWFTTAFGAVVLIDALVTKRWRRLNTILRLVTALTIALGFAAGATILGALITSSGNFHGIPYESAGWPIEWKTSPWLRSEPECPGLCDSIRAGLRPFNMLGFSPLYLGMTFVLWFIVAVGAQALFLIGQSIWRTLRPAPGGSPVVHG